MTDTIEMPSEASAEESRTHNKNLIFAALAEAGIHRVTVDYDGCGGFRPDRKHRGVGRRQ
jgi:hypothetical protein